MAIRLALKVDVDTDRGVRLLGVSVHNLSTEAAPPSEDDEQSRLPFGGED